MKKLFSYKTLFFILLPAFVSLVVWNILPREEIDYNAQVKPIFNKHCISCHGGVKKSGGFSLLFEAEAKGNTDSGSPAIIPGRPGQSELIRRLTTDDPEERMPYEKPALSRDEIKILKRWIGQGAKWDTHWSYVPVKKVEAPDGFREEEKVRQWAQNDIDLFIYEKLEQLKLSPNPEAGTDRLARRLSFDLIGLPVPDSIYAGLGESSPETLKNELTEVLLNSPHFGEKWAGIWMDLARYSDTKGYERDDSRTIWKYRDWLIKAFNDDKPYDRFLIEQIAGDLLTDPTDDQRIATAFHRNTMTNDEGGTDNEEFRVAAVVDRVNTTWEVIMGTTFACVQCHGHPYDPFTHEDYYKFLAYFNNSRDEDTFDDYPVFRHFEKDDSIKLAELTVWLKEHADRSKRDEIVKFVKTWQPSYNSLKSDQFVNSELADTKWLVFRNHGSSRLRGVDLNGKNTMIYRYRGFLPGGIWGIHLDSADGPLLKEVKVEDTGRRWTYNEIAFDEVSGRRDLYFTYSNPNLKNPLSNGLMFDWFYFTASFPGKGKPGRQKAKNDYWHLVTRHALQTPVMIENPPSMSRTTHIFDRGNWMTPGKQVVPGMPAIMNALPDGVENNRLGMAKWLASTQNPLTARTYVNRIWEQLFGSGIVETLEDFGSQGIPPTHRKLLDHLAWKFMRDFNWSTKRLLKYIVSSATYQQSSHSRPEQLSVDPQNKFLSRGPRIRLTAEQIRDQALVVSGLFNPEMYGPGVMPYQPEGIWNSPYNSRTWTRSTGDDIYRRALYTYWKRTSPYPSMLIFDAMAREVCASRRISTNTPLQALVTLNDSVYVEASLHFAKRMAAYNGTIEDQIAYGYELMMNEKISSEKLEILMDLYNKVAPPARVKRVGYSRESPEDQHARRMAVLGNTMFNLDEFLMKN
ncbi:MAG: DUF1553 domain-containing protein [Cytophagales bacterium]|nr:DUF1553 domain-containing protein [Cytophagales bacterium]